MTVVVCTYPSDDNSVENKLSWINKKITIYKKSTFADLLFTNMQIPRKLTKCSKLRQLIIKNASIKMHIICEQVDFKVYTILFRPSDCNGYSGN